METILGFVVLTGPLVPILLLALISIPFAVFIGKKVTSKSLLSKVVGGGATFFIILLLPLSDEIAGRIYLNHLCETQSNIEVLDTIELPSEFWGPNDQALFMNSRGVLDMKLLGDRFEWRQETETYCKGIVNINKHNLILYDREQQKVLGIQSSFSRKYGLLVNTFNPSPKKGEGCRTVLAKKHPSEFEALEISQTRDFMLKIFVPLID